MDADQKLSEQIKIYQQLGQENKNVDVASLMLTALSNQSKNLVSGKAKKWAYLISVSLPPFGLLFAAKYYFSGEDDAMQVANICVGLTAFSVLSYFILGKAIFSGSGASLSQIEQIKPSQIQELGQ